MIAIDPRRLFELTPSALITVRDAFDHANSTMLPFGVLDNHKRVSHFLSQILHETDGFRKLQENMNYTAPRLMAVWPSRFPTHASAKPYEFNPHVLANKVYGGRMGNTLPDDGWTYIGKGLIQITGRDMYRKVGHMLAIDLENNPYLAIDPRYSLQIACCVWRMKGGNQMADTNDVKKVTRAVCGSLIGLGSRMIWLDRVRHMLGIANTVEV
jgi:putative chitinase